MVRHDSKSDLLLVSVIECLKTFQVGKQFFESIDCDCLNFELVPEWAVALHLANQRRWWCIRGQTQWMAQKVALYVHKVG